MGGSGLAGRRLGDHLHGDRRRLRGCVLPRQGHDVLCRNAGDLRHALGRVFSRACSELVVPDRVALDVVLVDEAFGNDDVHHAERERRIGAHARAHVPVGLLRGARTLRVDDDNLREEVKSATGSGSIRLGLNSVGGDSALRLANCLAPGGTLVSFGAMSLQPLKIATGLLIFKDLRFRGIWINKWYDNATPSERMETFRSLFDMVQRGLLKTKVEKAYPLSEVKAAVAHAAQGKRSGKIILEFE